MSESDRPSFIATLTPMVQRLVDGHERLEGQATIIVPKLSFSDDGSRIILELGSGYIPKHYSFELEENINEISTTIFYYMLGRAPVEEIDFLYDGLGIFDYFPGEVRISGEKVADGDPGSEVFFRADAGKGRVVVAAGHGVYLRTNGDGWTTQRQASNLVLEDLVTPAFADRLQRYITEQAGIEVFRARSQSWDRHIESGFPWRHMAARYFLKAAFPDVPDIWNSKPGEGGANEEREQDIRSRPNFSNFIGADALINLHTNAAAESVRGLRVYYQKGRVRDRSLASLALCYMKESLRANRAYATFPIAAEPHPGNYGETRLSDAPSIIVEFGFHTNPEDAKAISSATFQAITTSGLAKAYRLFQEGKSCEPFEVSYPDVELVSESTISVPITFNGFPRFPVSIIMRPLECPSGAFCAPRYKTFGSAETALVDLRKCLATDSDKTYRYALDAKDADGIEAHTETKLVCKTKSV